MYIYIFPKYQCLEIAKKNHREQYQSDEDLLHYLPDDMFNRILIPKQECGDCYKVDGVVSCFRRIPKDFAKPVPEAVVVSPTTKVFSMDSSIQNTGIEYNFYFNFSNYFTIGSDPWIMKTNLETGIIEVNPEIIDRQPDKIVQDILRAIDHTVLECYLREKKKDRCHTS